MKNIDFLPERYHERDLKRKAAIWQFALLLGFGGLMLASTIGQIVMKRAVQTSLSELTESRIEANLKRQRVALLKQQLGSSEEVAELADGSPFHVRTRWPPSRRRAVPVSAAAPG